MTQGKGVPASPPGTRPVRSRVVGRYLIHGVIGHGGMAAVHLGRLRGDAGFSRVVAVKRLQESLAHDPSFVRMFTDEARLAARIRHPNVVPTLDVVSRGDELFHVMEYVHGETVARLVRAAKQVGAKVPVDVAVRVACDTLHGLHAAHEATDERGEALGLVHRDVSPQNVIVGVDGVARVLDFGVAKARGLSQTTKAGGIKGKVGYMPPEQLYGERVDRRADVYASGVVLWEMLTGKRLFAGEEGEDALALALTAPVSRPSIHNELVDDELDRIVLRALDRERDKRFATAQQMADAVVAVVSPAQPSKVAAWVRELAGDVIEQRGRMVAEIEAHPDPDHEEEVTGGSADPSDRGTSLLDDSLPATLAQSSQPSFGPGRTLLPVVILVAAAALLAAAVLIAGAIWLRPGPAAPTPLAGTNAVPAASSTARLAATASAPAAAASSSAPAEAASAEVPAQPKHTAPPRVVRPTPAPKPDCNPPWEIDAKGHRRYKRECF